MEKGKKDGCSCIKDYPGCIVTASTLPISITNDDTIPSGICLYRSITELFLKSDSIFNKKLSKSCFYC